MNRVLPDEKCNLLVLKKNGQTYTFRYDDHQIAEVKQTLGRWAADPELQFNWYDAAVLCQRIRRKEPK